MSKSSEEEGIELLPREPRDDIPVSQQELDGFFSDPKAFDNFLTRVYLYFTQKGFYCLLLEKIVNLGIFLFIVGFGIFLLSFVNYSVLFSVNSSSTNQTIPLSSAIDFSIGNIHPLTWVITALMMTFWLLNVIQFCRDIPDLLRIRRFYREELHILDINHTTWNDITELLLKKQRSTQAPQDALSLTQRILRRENYIIAFMNRDILGIRKHKLGFFYTKPLEWCLNYSIWNYLFENETIRPELLKPHLVLAYSQELAMRIRICSVLFFLLSPIILMYLLVYYLFAYFDQIRNTPSLLGGRIWTRYAMWKFREFNELPHYFYARLTKSRLPADKYMASFASHLIPLLARLFAFLAGSFLTMIILGSFVSGNILISVTILNQSLFYYVGILGIALTGLRAAENASTEATALPEPQKHLDEVIEHIHYSPKSWRCAYSKEVFMEVSHLYVYRVVLFLKSMLSVVTSPFILYFYLVDESEKIIRFVQEFTIKDPDVGYICSFSQFSRLEHHGNIAYGAPVHAEKSMRSKYGKLEKSVMTFSTNAVWQPPESCRSLLRNVEQYASTLTPPEKKKNNGMLAISQYAEALSRDERKRLHLGAGEYDPPIDYMIEDSV